MSVIQTVEAVPRRFEILFGLVAAQGESGMEFAELQRLATASAKENSVVFSHAFREAVRLGLLERRDQSVSIPNRGGDKWNEVRIKQEFRHRLGQILLPDPADEDAIERAADFPLSLAWLLLQSPWRPLRSDLEPATRLREQIADSAVRGQFTISTLNKYQNFVYWARFMGFCSYLKMSTSGFHVVPDATLALRRVLDDLLPSGALMSASEFVSRVGTTFEVLDGGRYRTRLLEAWTGPRPEPNVLSGALSLALRRIEQSGEIVLEMQSDADAWYRDDPTAPMRFNQLRRR